LRAALLVIVFLLFGVLPEFAGTHCFYKISSPLCAFLKPVLFVSQGNLTIPTKFFIYFNVIIGLSLIGKNLFCGWICPMGALQEIIHLLSEGIKKRRIPFSVSSPIRLAIFISAMMLLFTVSLNIYFDFLDPFIVLTWKFSADTGFLVSLAVLLLAAIGSLFFFRPYCYLVCPIGLFTWVSGHFSLFRIKLDKDRCSRCMACVKDSACPAIESVMNGDRSIPDCYLCGQCISKCKEKALSFTMK
jgi:polyferredoxin